MNTQSEGSLNPPESTVGDMIHSAVKGGLGMIPIVGSPLAELLPWLITPPIEKRRQEWMQKVGEGLIQLGKNVDELKQQFDSPEFVDIVLQASHIAMRTSQQERLDALRNAILNAALPSPPDQTRQLMFLSLVDALTAQHLQVLKMLKDPPGWFREHGGSSEGANSVSGVLCLAFSDLRPEKTLREQIVRDLFNRGLVATDSIYTSCAPPIQRQATDFGLQFLKFIATPMSLADEHSRQRGK